MKKTFIAACLAAALLTQTGCATIFFGTSPDQHCKTAPQAGQPSREIHVGALIFDFLCGLLPLVVDIADGAIYKPCNGQGTAPAKPHNRYNN